MIIRFLKSPIGPLTGAVSGILISQLSPEFVKSIAPFGKIIPTLISMCTIPILFTAVSLSITNFLTAKVKLDLRKIAIPFALVFLLSSSIGILMAFLTRPGYILDTEASPKLRQFAIEAAEIERSLDTPIEGRIDDGTMQLLQDAVPSNIFEAVATDKFLQVLIFSIIFGITLAFVQVKSRASVTNVLDAVRETFEKIYDAVLIMMPVVIFMIMATDFSEVGAETLIGMLPFILSVYASFLVMFTIGMGIIAYKLKINPIKAISMIHEPIVIAIATHSGIAAIPSAIKVLIENYKLDKTVVNILVSAGLVLGEFGLILYFSFSCIFIAQYYDHSLAVDPINNLHSIIFILLMSVVASWTAIGSPHKLSLGAMIFVLDPLGLPLSAFLVLFVVIDYIIDPFRSVILLQGNLTAIVLAARNFTQADHFAGLQKQVRQSEKKKR